jgi:LysR family transcriptional regulator for metE and metH
MKRIAQRTGGRTADLPRLEIRDLEVVLTLARAGSTVGAGSALHLTQSAVSRALCQAEEKLGVRLFDRTRHGLSPTPAGERLIAGAGPILAQLSALERELGGPRAADRTRVRLVAECYTAYRWLPSAIARLRTSLPRVEIALAIQHTDDPMKALCRDEVDIALLTTAQLPAARAARTPLAEAPLFSDEVVFLMSTAHPLAARRSLSPADLRENQLISSRAPVSEQRWFVRSVFGRARPALALLRFPLTEAVVDAARAGMGVAILSEWIASGYLDSGGLTIRRLASGRLLRPWRIAYRRTAADAARQLIAALDGASPRLRSGAGERTTWRPAVGSAPPAR